VISWARVLARRKAAQQTVAPDRATRAQIGGLTRLCVAFQRKRSHEPARQVNRNVRWACWKEASIFNEEELGFANYSSFRYNDPNCGETNYIGLGLESRS